jgi:hypothetical protein
MDIVEKIDVMLDEKWNYVILVYFNESIIHSVGYTQEPVKHDLDDLRRELKEDDEFGLCEIANQVRFLVAPLTHPLSGKEIAEKMVEINNEIERLSAEEGD